MKYKRRRRRILPAVYNRNRLREKPLPNTQPDPVIHIQPSTPNLDTPPNSPVPAIDEDEAIESIDSGSNISFSEQNGNQDDAENINSAAEEVVCLSESDQIEHHHPMHFDIVSGRYSFDQSVITNEMIIFSIQLNLTFLLQNKFDRIYNVNGKRFQLKKSTVDRLLYYNKSPSSKTSLSVDKTFVELLLLSVFNVNDLKRNQIDNDMLEIVKCA